jgi:arylsulfatase A-like enzyme
MSKFLLVVFDGLRPDMVRPDTTPNLVAFAGAGTRFLRARSVFPSETRVCSASVATGCLPRRHGLVANRIPHPFDARRSVDTGHMNLLKAIEQDTGAPLLDTPTLARMLHSAGRDFAVLSSGTTGQTYVLNPEADALGQLTLSAHGPEFCSERGRTLLARLDPPPAAPAERAVWLAEAYRTHILPGPPDVSILWLCEPDTSGHYQGLGSPAQLDALRAADAAFGRIVADWRAGPWRDDLTIAVASDHGHATITGLRAIAPTLAGSPAAGATLMPGSSCGLAWADAGGDTIAAAADWLTTQDWVGSVFATDGIDLPTGVLPSSALLANHPRAAQVVFTLRSDNARSERGLTGTTLYDGNLPLGGGTHGGLLAAELHTVLMFAGAAIGPGQMSELPAGLCDLAPTALALLGLPGAEAMDGRVLTEALTDGTAPDLRPATESWEAAQGAYRQRLARTRLGRHIYLDEGVRG